MSLNSYQYIMPRGVNAEGLAEILHGHGLRLELQPSVATEREFYDTFDWRLYAAGLVFFIDRSRDGTRLHLRALADGLDIVSVAAKEVPGFAHELPAGVLRDRLLPLAESRRLLGIASLKCSSRCFKVLDEENKTVARVLIERHGVVTGEGARRLGLGERLVVAPVRGYSEPLQQLRALFEHELGLVRLNGAALEEALAALGRHPLDYSSKLRVPLPAGVTAGEAARRLLAALLNAVESNEDGVRQDLDPEFLHDLRVAVRRTRALLGQMKEALPRSCAHYRQEFAWIGRSTGAVRDLDVQMLAFPAHAAALGPGGLGDLEPLREVMRAQRSRERCDLLETLAAPRYRRLKKDWRALLENGDAAVWVATDEARRPALESASAMIEHRYHKVFRAGVGLTPESADTDMHRLRMQCKKLRYLLEFFAPLFPRDDIKSLVRPLKALQDNLGEFQDLGVLLEALPGYAERLNGGERANRARVALGLLMERLRLRKELVRAEFAAVWARFAHQQHQNRFNRLFGSD
ncbi:MAG: CHAD domain-containing protein [Gammaproteobacteria bacterium]|nr:CHAD domain-containing protein [Gammaproteobacteria bacterium]